MGLETVVAFGFVMTGLFYLSSLFEKESKYMAFIMRFVGMCFFWILIGVSGADTIYTVLGLTITIIPVAIWLFFKFKGMTFDEFLKIMKTKEKDSYTWGEEVANEN